MKKADVTLGGLYKAKVSGNVVTVRIDAESPHGGWDATNIATNRKVRIKSPQRLRGPANRPARRQRVSSTAEALKATAAADQENARLRDERKAAKDGRTASERAMDESAEPAAKATAKKGTRAERNSCLDAAAIVLDDAGEPLNAKALTERMLAKGLWSTGGKTPHATVYAAIIREIANKGEASRFRKTSRGHFELAAG